ncbi:MAG TPA: hypothetical protein VLU25_06195 [Acidobacteriota bacterium]|nr:hypothetical protein [Acidobacteriota bacterium]
MIQRTTVAAEEGVLEALRREAQRRGVSFATLVGELLAKKAAELRRARRPRIGIGHSGSGVAQESVDHEDLPAAQ